VEQGRRRVTGRDIFVPTSEEYERGELGERRDLGPRALASLPVTAVEPAVHRLKLEVPDEVVQRPITRGL